MKGCISQLFTVKEKTANKQKVQNQYPSLLDFKLFDTVSFSSNGLLTASHIMSLSREEKSKDSPLGFGSPGMDSIH